MSSPVSLPTRRLFVALPLCADTLAGIAAFSQQNRVLQADGLRWMRTENLHITVFFLGAVASDRVDELCLTLYPVLENAPPLALRFQCFCMEPQRRPRMIWARYHQDPAFTALVHAVGEVCTPFLLDKPQRFPQPVPHITVARMKRAMSGLQQVGELPVFVSERVELWCSQQGQRGVVYERLRGWTLAG